METNIRTFEVEEVSLVEVFDLNCHKYFLITFYRLSKMLISKLAL